MACHSSTLNSSSSRSSSTSTAAAVLHMHHVAVAMLRIMSLHVVVSAMQSRASRQMHLKDSLACPISCVWVN